VLSAQPHGLLERRIICKGDLFQSVSLWRIRFFQSLFQSRHLSLEHWLDYAETGFKRNEPNLVQTMKNNDSPGDARLIAAILVSADESVDPESLFYSNLLLLSPPDLFGLWREDVEDDLTTLIVNAWSRVIANHRALLLSPGLTVPSIRAACDDQSRGLENVARILLAARLALSTRSTTFR